MKSINKTKDLWNKDLAMKGLKDEISPMCCWVWCFWWNWW